MVTLTERLDELLGMARHVGYLEAQATAAEHRADMAPKGSTARPRRDASQARKLATMRATELANSRARYLETYK